MLSCPSYAKLCHADQASQASQGSHAAHAAQASHASYASYASHASQLHRSAQLGKLHNPHSPTKPWVDTTDCTSHVKPHEKWEEMKIDILRMTQPDWVGGQLAGGGVSLNVCDYFRHSS